MTGKNPRRKFWRDNGLTLLFLAFFVLTLFGGQFLTGFRVHNEDLADHGQASLTLLQYLLSNHFLEATMENWESEFLQMFAFVLATAWFFQRGSAESHDPDEKHDPEKPIKGPFPRIS